MNTMGANTKDKSEQKTRRRPGRVPTSCAECRRLKLRCDRNVPCEKCVSRGCGSICPDGYLTPGKGNRLILANTEELHDRIELLCSRIRELEDALKSLQGTVSETPHPLLRPDLLQLKAPQVSASAPSTSSTPNTSSPPHDTTQPPADGSPDISEPLPTKTEDESFIDAFGTLTIGLHGEATFLGKTARSEYLIRALAKPQPVSNVVFPRLSSRIIGSAFPESDVHHDESLGREIFGFLPPLSEAFRLCEIYFEHGKYLYTPVSRTALFDDVLTAVYRAESFETFQCHHGLALLFIVFAIAVLFDPERPAYCIAAQEYYYLSRTSLGFTPPVRETTLTSIQVLIHMAQYLELSDWESLGSNPAWIYIGHAVRLGHSIGLHLNSARWKLNEDATQKRSRIFWQLFLLDTWGSFYFGRPPSMSAAYIDCAFPKDTDEVANQLGEMEIGYHSWCWRYTALMHTVMTTAFGTKLPAYATIIDLDRKIRDFPVPVYLRPHCTEEVPPPTVVLLMQRWWVVSSKETTLLNLHRGYFAQALHDQPTDLVKHRYGPSVLATYRSAWRLIAGLLKTWSAAPQLLSRVSLAWSQSLSAAIVMCLLVTRAPMSSMTSSSLEELDKLASLFEEAAPSCRSASNILDSIQNLRRKAHEAINQSHSQDTTTFSPAELDRLGGQTHLISRPGVATAGDTFSTTSQSTSVAPPEFAVPYSSLPTNNIHPTIAQDMRTFDLGGPAFDNVFDFPSESSPHPMPDIQFTDNIFSGQSMGNFQMGGYQLPITGYPSSPCAPVLDATWQSFVEQLGF